MEVEFVLERNHGAGQVLVIEGYDVGLYPISYTVDECLEDFCHKWEWEFDQQTSMCYNWYVSGEAWVNRSIVSGISFRETLSAAEQRYRNEETSHR